MKVYIIKVVGGKDETTTVIYRMSVRKHSKYASISKVLDGFFKKYPDEDRANEFRYILNISNVGEDTMARLEVYKDMIRKSLEENYAIKS